MTVQVHFGDCLDILPTLPAQSVEAIITDLPYGTTACKWDEIIPFAPMWEQVKRVLKPRGVFVTTASQPFVTDLINSNRKMFRYEIIWKKTQPQGFLNANKAPLRAHENILVFYEHLPTYHPIKSIVERNDIGRVREVNAMRSKQYREMNRTTWIETGERYPTDVIEFSNWNGALFGKNTTATKHPTQKPTALYRYLILTYTNPGDTVLDFAAGSGTTAIAAIDTGRDCILVEKEPEYCEIIRRRIATAQQQPRLEFA